MSHLSSIGFTMTPEAFQEHTERAAPDCVRFDTSFGSYLQWSLGAGVELWMQVNAVDKIVGCNPHFFGQGRLEAAVIETASAPGHPLDGHCYGWAAPRDPGNPYSGLHAIAASLPNFAVIDELILTPPVVTLQIAAFASRMECFPTEGAFVDSETGRLAAAEIGGWVWRHSEEDGLPQPEAFLTGQVAHSERQANPVTGQEFHTLVVRTEAGTIDVVADLDTSPRRPVAGTVIAGTFWLSARVITELPPARNPGAFESPRDRA